MKQKAASAYHQIAKKSYHEDLVMLVAAAADNSPNSQCHKQQVCQRIDNLGRVYGRIVILSMISSCLDAGSLSRWGSHRARAYLFTPVESRCNGTPKPGPRGRIRNRRKRPVHGVSKMGDEKSQKNEKPQ